MCFSFGIHSYSFSFQLYWRTLFKAFHDEMYRHTFYLFIYLHITHIMTITCKKNNNVFPYQGNRGTTSYIIRRVECNRQFTPHVHRIWIDFSQRTVRDGPGSYPSRPIEVTVTRIRIGSSLPVHGRLYKHSVSRTYVKSCRRILLFMVSSTRHVMLTSEDISNREKAFQDFSLRISFRSILFDLYSTFNNGHRWSQSSSAEIYRFYNKYKTFKSIYRLFFFFY